MHQFPYSSAGSAKVSDIQPKLVGLKPNALSVRRAIIIKDAQIKRTYSQNAPTVKDHMLHPTKGVQHTKNRHLGNMWWTAKNRYASILRQNSSPLKPQDKALTFSAEQLIKFVANMAFEVAQPQVCYANPNQDAIDKKLSLCRRVSEAAKNHLGVNVTGINLFDSIGQLGLSAPCASKPKTSLTKGEPHSNSHHPPKSPNHLPYLNLSAPLAQLTRLSPNRRNPLNRTPSRPSLMTGI